MHFAGFVVAAPADRALGAHRHDARGSVRRADAGLPIQVAVAVERDRVAAADAVFAPDAFIRIDRDGTVSVVVSQVEMGQGTYTSMPMLVAEELAVDLAKVKVVAAPGEGGLTSVQLTWSAGA